MSRRIGCKNLHYAIVTKGENGQVSYGTPVPIKKLISVKTTDQFAEYTFYSDDSTEESSRKLTGCEIEIEVGALDNKTKSALTGVTFKEGKLIRKANDASPTVALLWEITRSEGDKSEYRVLYRCSLSLKDAENTTIEDSIESNNMILTGNAIPDENGVVDLEIYGGDVGAESLVTNFFKAVVLPDGAGA